jgi:hypothetical protein
MRFRVLARAQRRIAITHVHRRDLIAESGPLSFEYAWVGKSDIVSLLT